MRRYSATIGRLAFAVALLASPMPSAVAVAQAAPKTIAPTTAGKVHRITLKSGSELMGRVISVDATSIQFESDLGNSTIALDNILSFREEEPGYRKDGKFYYPNPNQTRLVFAPTGRMLKAREGYFTDFWIFFPAVAVGITDRVTIGGGISIIPGTSPSDQLFFLTPKVGIIQRDRFNVAVGALAMALPAFDAKRVSAGVVYGVGTWGSTDHSLTAGLGYGYVDDRLADRPVIMVGGETRVTPGFSLVTENYVFPGNNGLLSGGVRFMGRAISVDLALMRPMTSGESITFPMVGFMWKW